MRRRTLLLLALALLPLAALGLLLLPRRSEFEARCARLRWGMTHTEVLAIMGPAGANPYRGNADDYSPFQALDGSPPCRTLKENFDLTDNDLWVSDNQICIVGFDSEGYLRMIDLAHKRTFWDHVRAWLRAHVGV